MFLVFTQWNQRTHYSTTRIENDKFVIIKSGNCLMSESISLSQNYRSMLLFFGQTVEDFLKYDYKNNPKQNNDPFIITEYDRVIQNIVKVWFTFKRNLLILSTKVPLNLKSSVSCANERNRFFIEFCSSSKPIGKIICRYDAQKCFEQFKHTRTFICNMMCFHF
jgi:hypothetical protein